MVERLAGFGLVVGVGDMGVGTPSDGQLITYALGSCIGVSAFDPVARIGGLLHFMLPEPGADSAEAEARPCAYGSSGLPLLFQKLREAGAVRERCVICAVGGAEISAAAGAFAIGRRNRALLRQICCAEGVALAAEDTGGKHPRTLVLSLSDGTVRVRSTGRDRLLWAPGMPVRPVLVGPPAPSREGT